MLRHIKKMPMMAGNATRMPAQPGQPAISMKQEKKNAIMPMTITIGLRQLVSRSSSPR